jgi:cell division protein ZapD
MSKSAEAVIHTATSESLLRYEQPLNERMRTFLRLEFLYDQLRYHTEQTSAWSSRGSISSLLDIVAILSRGDVRGDVLKELERQIFMMDRLSQVEDVDSERLTEVVDNLRKMRAQLMEIGPKYLQELRDNEFLNAIRHRSSIPGGTCAFDLPEYTHWLRQSYKRRAADIGDWMESVRALCEGVGGLLWLLRNGKQPVQQVAVNGVYQHTMLRETVSTLVQISLPAAVGFYPEISGGHHRFTIRMMQWEQGQARPTQTTNNVTFDLTVC